MAITDNKFTKYTILTFIVIFIFLFAISISGGNLLYLAGSLGAEFGFAGFCYLIYNSRDYSRDTFPIFKKGTVFFSVIAGVSIGVSYLILTNLIPGLSIGITLIPQSISSNIQWFTVNIVAPVIETILIGVLLIMLLKTKFGRNNRIVSVLLVGAFMALLHLGAYVYGFVDLNVSDAIGAFSGNIGAFISAFIFFSLCGFLILWKKSRSLIIAILPHFIINFTNFAKAVTIFAITMGLIK
jgi:hypothetical protein